MEEFQSQEMEKMAANILYKMGHEGKTLKEAVGVSDDLLEQLYALAYSFYDQGKYTEALQLFHFITSVEPKLYRYVLGLAACYHQLGDYENASIGFFMALNLEENPIPAYYIADCFLKVNDYLSADNFLELSILLSDSKPEFSSLKNQSLLLRKNLNCK